MLVLHTNNREQEIHIDEKYGNPNAEHYFILHRNLYLKRLFLILLIGLISLVSWIR